jgi:hypothetical protein
MRKLCEHQSMHNADAIIINVKYVPKERRCAAIVANKKCLAVNAKGRK